MAVLTNVRRYRPGAVPVGQISKLWEFLRREFQAVSAGIDNVYSLPVLGVEPKKYQEGALVYANGTTWDPGSGKGVYVYDGAAWVKL